MKSVLISIQPKWCELIASGNKTVEVRKTKPKLDAPFKVYIYETKESKRRFLDHRFNSSVHGFSHHTEMGKVIGEFVCNMITSFKAMGEVQALYNETQNTCLTHDEIIEYAKGKKLYYWHISDLVIYDEPKKLGDFVLANTQQYCHLQRPPQSWCYVEVKDNA